MIMKRILYYIWILPLMLSGCEKDLMDYEGLEGVLGKILDMVLYGLFDGIYTNRKE